MSVYGDLTRARLVASALVEAYREYGIFGQQTMPEDQLPIGVEAGSETHLRFITLTVAIDYMRDADQLWDAARQTLADPNTVYLFDPPTVAQTGALQVTQDLSRYHLSRKRDNDAQTWHRICVALTRDFSGQVSSLIDQAQMDAVNLLALVRSPRYRSGFPFVKGPKIGPLWIRMLRDDGRVPLTRVADVPLPVDIHTAQATIQTGCVIPSTSTGRMSDLRQAVQEVWRDALTDAEPHGYPLQLDEPLWLLSRHGCRTTAAWPCEHRSRCPVADWCLPTYRRLTITGDVTGEAGSGESPALAEERPSIRGCELAGSEEDIHSVLDTVRQAVVPTIDLLRCISMSISNSRQFRPGAS